MIKTYTVSQDSNSKLWYAHKVGFPTIPVIGSFSLTKRIAQSYAANAMGLPISEYLKLRG